MATTLLTDKGYFLQEPRYIEQAEVNSGIPSDVYYTAVRLFDVARLQYEREYLERLMGKALRDKFTDEITDIKWKGLKAILWAKEEVAEIAVPVFTDSPVADYIYFWYLNDHASVYNGQNFRVTKSESSIQFSVVQKQVWIWQRMKEKTIEAMNWLIANPSVFGDVALDNSKWKMLLVNYNSYGI